MAIETLAKQHTFICIDLKSFYASVECVQRGRDPLRTNLVVADPTRTEKTICLAVTPSLKAFGIPGRARLFEVVERVREVNDRRRKALKDRTFTGKSDDADALERDPSLELTYVVAPPQMRRYMEVSGEIFGIYLQYVAPEDIFPYSVDEVFMDVTAYLRTYKMTAHELAIKMIKDVLRRTGITATAGIGTNPYLAKIAMDIVAKHMPADADGVRIAELDEMSYRRYLWTHTPLTDFWRIGPATARKLAARGLFTMGDVARCSLENEDVLFISVRKDKMNQRTVTIFGEVQFPATYEYSDNETIEDLIILAGGLTDAASTAKVDVSRRIIDPSRTTDSKEIAQTFSFTMRDGLLIGGDRNFTLQPYDEVYVRKSPGFVPQRNVTVDGEVMFAGTYALSQKNQRISELIKAAGGVTDEAYVRGARIERPLNEDEKFRLNRLLKMVEMQGGSGLDAGKVSQDTVYYVGIELDKALANPGSDYDVILREGDRLVVPEYSGTVKINGNVMYPNTVAYSKGKSYKWYINEAGGYGNGAKRSKAFILYQNGKVSKASKGKVEPGCEIIIPNKTRSANDNISMIANLGTSLATMVTMIATVTNLIKSF